MNQDEKKLIELAIGLPLALKVFQIDYQFFSSLKTARVYQDKLESVMNNIKHDISQTKNQLYKQHHIIIQQIDPTHFKWAKQRESGTLTYTPEELKNIARDIMRNYLYGDKSTNYEAAERPWEGTWNPEYND